MTESSDTKRLLSDVHGERLDVYLAGKFKGDYSRAYVQQCIKKGAVTVNGCEVTPHYMLKHNDSIVCQFEHREAAIVPAEHIPLDILYEDAAILIVNKAAGMVVHPGAGNRSHTLVNAVAYHTQGTLSDASGSERAGIVHRLDKDTSGVIVIAKTNRAHMRLAEQFKQHTVEKKYAVIVKGVVQHDQGKCDIAIGRGKVFRTKMMVTETDGKPASTEYTVRKRFTNATLLEVRIHTGRTHQIRVHMAHMGHPVLGDRTYGGSSPLAARQCLHASVLAIDHPDDGRRLVFEAPLPAAFRQVVTALEKR